MRMHNPPHPGTLVADILENRNLSIGKSITALARHLRVSRGYLSRFIRGKAGLKADMALRLQEAFGLKAQLLLEMQAGRRLWVASQMKRKKLPNLLRCRPLRTLKEPVHR